MKTTTGDEVATNLISLLPQSRMTVIKPDSRPQKNPHRRGDGDLEEGAHAFGTAWIKELTARREYP